ncbi:MAG: hypothetical protein RIT45_4364 [Pseudomonadota bacterium]|jgi:hypothetical protein
MQSTPNAWPSARPELEEGVALAVALASELAPIGDDATALGAALTAFAEGLGLRVVRHHAPGRALLIFGPRGADAAGKGIGLCAAVQPPASLPETPLHAVLPSGLWSACLAIATAGAALQSGSHRVTAVVELPSAAEGSDAALGSALDVLAHQHVLVGGDGGSPYFDGDRIFVALSSARRGAMWLELTAESTASASDDLSIVQGGAAETLIAALGRLPRFEPGGGPMWEAQFASYAEGVDAERLAWITQMSQASGAELESLMAQIPVTERAYVRALGMPTVTVARLDAGTRLDRAARKARAVLDVRTPPGVKPEALVPEFREALPKEVRLETLATRPSRMLSPDHGIFAAVRRSLAAARTPFTVMPALTRREPVGLHWEQPDVPVVGFAPAWAGLEFDVAAGLRNGAVPIDEAGLRWGAALYVRVVFELAGIEAAQ